MTLVVVKETWVYSRKLVQTCLNMCKHAWTLFEHVCSQFFALNLLSIPYSQSALNFLLTICSQFLTLNLLSIFCSQSALNFFALNLLSICSHFI